MKKTIMSFIFVFIMTSHCFGGEIFTAPIDGRPVSVEYLERLAHISGDSFTCVTKDSLDYFSGRTETDHTGSSPSVRSQIYEMAGKNNSPDSTFIINTTSYLTGGLVGSRTASGYTDVMAAAADLDRLMTDFPQPNYYINIPMPRTLPETRLGSIWTDDRVYEGLGSFYLKENRDSPLKSEIAKSHAHVGASQLLLEWAYVKNHEAMGEISSWEKAFLNYFENSYENKDPYKVYLKNYRLPYSELAFFAGKVMELSEKHDFEIIISVDDFQLPDFIELLKDEELTQDEVKYSFALNYMQNILFGKAKTIYGKQQLELACHGKGDRINIIYGTDEVPQLIYARDLAKRTNIMPNLLIRGRNIPEGGGVAKFDARSPYELSEAAVNFVSVGERKSRVRTDIFLFDYNSPTGFAKFTENMKTAYDSGNSVALIELYTTNETAYGKNLLFKSLKEMSEKNEAFGLHSLAAYSSWNTSANAIGLGTANAAVYSINKEINNTPDFIRANLEMLMGHALEDGVYNCYIKRQLYGYYPYYDENNVRKLEELFAQNDISRCFTGKTYDTAEGVFEITDAGISECSFPWDRTFECYVKPVVKGGLK